MRILAILSMLALLAPAGLAEEQKADEEVVKAVRAMLSTRKAKERDELKAALLKRPGLDWLSVKKGLMTGPYYQKPMVTGYGDRHSSRHMGIRWTGKDGKKRGFSVYVPKSYNAKDRIPVLFYLHHGASAQGGGAQRAGLALSKFRTICEDAGFLFVAPYTTGGAEWWTPEGKRLVEWTLEKVKERYNIDENRVALMGALDGGDAVWSLGQEMPDTWSCLMPMTGDPYEITAIIKPICLGTLDRMDVLMGVPGKTRSTVGEKNALQFLGGLKPMFEKRMRITTAVYTTAVGDFRYLDQIKEMVAAFVIDKKRKPTASEVDIDTTSPEGQRSLWLQSHGYDPDGAVAGNFPSTLLQWAPPEAKKQPKRIGITPGKQWDVGIVIKQVDNKGGAFRAKILPGDILYAIDGVEVKKGVKVQDLVAKREWGDEVELTLARETKVSDIKKIERQQRNYMTIRRKVKELRAAGKKIPANRDVTRGFLRF